MEGRVGREAGGQVWREETRAKYFPASPSSVPVSPVLLVCPAPNIYRVTPSRALLFLLLLLPFSSPSLLSYFLLSFLCLSCVFSFLFTFFLSFPFFLVISSDCFSFLVYFLLYFSLFFVYLVLLFFFFPPSYFFFTLYFVMSVLLCVFFLLTFFYSFSFFLSILIFLPLFYSLLSLVYLECVPPPYFVLLFSILFVYLLLLLLFLLTLSYSFLTLFYCIFSYS